MTTEEAIKELNAWAMRGYAAPVVAIYMAIEALKVKNSSDSLLTEDLDLISRQDAIEAMWKALYAYEDLTEKQFMEHEELELGDWFQHRIFVQRMHEECMKAVNSLPSAEAPYMFSEAYVEQLRFDRDHLQDVVNKQWILCGERLPEFDTKVLAWVENKDPKNRFNKPGIYIAELKDKEVEHDPDGDRNLWGIPGYDSVWTVWAWSYFAEPDVKAWMPLLEPYNKK